MCRLSDNFNNKGRKVCCKVSLYENCQRQSCSAVNWQGVAPFPWYLNAKGATRIESRCIVYSCSAGGTTICRQLYCIDHLCCVTWPWRHAVVSADAGLLVFTVPAQTFCYGKTQPYLNHWKIPVWHDKIENVEYTQDGMHWSMCIPPAELSVMGFWRLVELCI